MRNKIIIVCLGLIWTLLFSIGIVSCQTSKMTTPQLTPSPHSLQEMSSSTTPQTSFTQTLSSLSTPTEENDAYPMLEVLPEEETDTPTPTLDATMLQEPRVELKVERTLYKVGESISINITVANLEQPSYDIILRDEGVQEDTPVAEIDANRQVTLLANDSRILELKSATAEGKQLTLVFLAKAPGKTTLTINAFRENSTDQANSMPYQMGSAELLIVVEK
ncbi:MAG: hypothetical protein ACPL3P_06660 [Anaerolineales bacterium]